MARHVRQSFAQSLLGRHSFERLASSQSLDCSLQRFERLIVEPVARPAGGLKAHRLLVANRSLLAACRQRSAAF
jgi:hypothetical protein